MTERTGRASGPADRETTSPPVAPLQVRFREKRLAAGLSQQELADRAGVRQSAISSFERRGYEAQALSADNIRQIADVLGVVVDEAPVAARPHAARLALFFCPNSDCPSALAYPVGSRTLYRPRFIRAEAEQRLYCPDCGEICESRCPGCRSAVSERLRGSACAECGTAYIEGENLAEPELQRRLQWQQTLAAAEPVVDYRHGRRPEASPA